MKIEDMELFNWTPVPKFVLQHRAGFLPPGPGELWFSDDRIPARPGGSRT